MTVDLTALDAANAALQTSPTVAKATKDFGAAATAVLHAMNGAPPPPSVKVKGMYDANGAAKAADWPAIAALGCNLFVCSADDSASLAAVKKTGGKAWVSPGYWIGSGFFSTTTAQAITLCQSAIATGAVAGLYLADEPLYSAANIAAVHARSRALKQACPGYETLIAYYDAGTVGAWKGAVDAFALDIYPARFNWNMSLITQLAAAADQAGLRYYGVVGVDGAPNYPMPTAAQLVTMIDRWAVTKQAGLLFYAWGAPGLVENQSALLDVIKAA